MGSQEKPKKRALPVWMTAMHSQTKQKRDTNDDEGKQGVSNTNGQDVGSGEQDQRTSDYENNSINVKHLKSANEFISDSMSFIKVLGTITYIFQTADCACVCDEILFSLDKDIKVPVGFDMEWPVSYKGSSKTALIQMYFDKDKCYLFQVSAMHPFPKQLTRLICDESLLLVGLNIESDLWKLEKDFDIRVKPLMDRGSVIDVGKLANKKLKSSERWDLNGLCKNLLSMKLNKDSVIRCGNWTDVPLSQDQIAYSSADAYAGLMLYLKLKDL